MSKLHSDYEKMSTKDLVRERESIDALLTERRDSEKQALLTEFRERAQALGIDPAELTGGSGRQGGRGKKRGTVRPKYRDPDDASRMWTGRGRKPKWVEAQLDAGKSLDDLLIERPLAAE